MRTAILAALAVMGAWGQANSTTCTYSTSEGKVICPGPEITKLQPAPMPSGPPVVIDNRSDRYTGTVPMTGSSMPSADMLIMHDARVQIEIAKGKWLKAFDGEIEPGCTAMVRLGLIVGKRCPPVSQAIMKLDGNSAKEVYAVAQDGVIKIVPLPVVRANIDTPAKTAEIGIDVLIGPLTDRTMYTNTNKDGRTCAACDKGVCTPMPCDEFEIKRQAEVKRWKMEGPYTHQ